MIVRFGTVTTTPGRITRQTGLITQRVGATTRDTTAATTAVIMDIVAPLTAITIIRGIPGQRPA